MLGDMSEKVSSFIIETLVEKWLIDGALSMN
jgi:hypothetical protein